MNNPGLIENDYSLIHFAIHSSLLV
jgi:hypothetical protein